VWARNRLYWAGKSPFLGKKSPFDGMISPLFRQENRPSWAIKSPLVGKQFAPCGQESRPFLGKNIVLFWTRKWMALMLPRSQIALNEQNCHSLYL